MYWDAYWSSFCPKPLPPPHPTTHPPQALADPLTREIWLSSEDTGAWGRDLGLALPDLLTALGAVLTSSMPPGTPPRCLLRVGMTNPPFVREHVADVAAFL